MEFFEQYDSELSAAELAAVNSARSYCSGEFTDVPNKAFISNEAFPREVIDDWASLGLLGLQVAPAHGGMGAGFLAKIRVAQEMARHGFATAFSLNIIQGVATRVSRSGNDEQRAAFLDRLISGELVAAPSMSEPHAGSDMGQMRCTATAVDGGWVLNGTKSWITNGTIVDLITVLCRVGDQTEGEVAGFLVQVAGDTIRRKEILLPGARSFRLAEIRFTNHFVPAWGLFYAPGQAFKASLLSINAARVHVAAMAVATLHGALAHAVRYCGSRSAFGKPVIEHQGIRWSLADVAMNMEAANALVFRAASAIERGKDVTILAAQAKTLATTSATTGVQACMQAMGAIGASAAYPLAMHAAEVRLADFANGTTEMLRDRSGKSLLKNFPDVLRPTPQQG